VKHLVDGAPDAQDEPSRREQITLFAFITAWLAMGYLMPGLLINGQVAWKRPLPIREATLS